MFQQELISQEEHDRLKMELEIAQQEVAEAQYRLGKTTIRAPFTGRVTERMVQVGHHIRLGDELYSVADFDPLVARIYLPERDILGLEAKREVRISLQADDSITFKGRIRQISPVVDVATGTVKVTVEAVEPPRQVRPGAFVTIDIERERHAEVVLLPRESVIRELQNSHVFVADGEVARKRRVTLGLEEGELIEALTGVEEGEQVIVAGQGGLKDGAPVKVIQVADAELGG